MKDTKRCITFHIGLHKTGTTYLQNNVFPFISGGTYLGTHPSCHELLARMAKSDGPYLVSSEDFSHNQFFNPPGADTVRRIAALARMFSANTRVIMSFREPSEWIVSSYRQYVHLGGQYDFEDFLSAHELPCLMPIIDALEAHFPGRYLLYDYAQLKEDPQAIICVIGEFAGGVSFMPITSGNDTSSNISVQRNGLRLLRRCNQVLNKNPYDRSGPSGGWLRRRIMLRLNRKPRQLIQRGMLKWCNQKGTEAIPAHMIGALRRKYETEWSQVQEAIRENQLNVSKQSRLHNMGVV